MKKVGKTLDRDGKFIDIFECEVCGYRYRGREICDNPKCGQENKLIWLKSKT